MKYLINGIVDIIKLGMILFAVFYAFESGIVDYIVNLFRWYGIRYNMCNWVCIPNM